MIPGAVRLEPTWRTRYERKPAPVLVLDREAQGFAASSAPLPAPYQTGFPPEFFDHLPGVCGRYPLGPFLPRYARALARGITAEWQEPGLDWSEPAPTARPVLTLTNRARHTTFRITVPDVDTPILPVDEWRTYLLIVNVGANDALISYDQASDGGLPLTANGGFDETVMGTVSAVRAQGVGGAATLLIKEGRSAVTELCRLNCN